MISPKIKLKGAKVFINKLNREMDTLQSKINEMVKLEGENLYSRSQRDVAVFSGDLKKTGKNLNIYNGKVLTSSVEYGNDMDVKYGAYKEFGTGKNLNLTVDDDQASVIKYASTFIVRRKNKNINTSQKKYIFKNAFMSKRNLVRKLNTLAKNL